MNRRSNKTLASKAHCYASIQEKTSVSDNAGGFVEEWSDTYSDIPMSIEPIREIRKAEFRTYNIEATHFITIRSNITVDTNNNRIKYGDRVFTILTSANPQERGVETLITAKEEL